MVYPSVRVPPGLDAPGSDTGSDAAARRGWFRVGPTVYALGATSLVTDISSEMVTAILPLYLVVQLGLDPLAFGIYLGLATGITGLMRIAGAVIADRSQRYKEVAGFGYALSLACKLGLLAVPQAAVPLEGVLVVDRVGKGVRTSPRDALISLSTPRVRLAEAFGVHRAMDTAGALLGPIVAFLVLEAIPRGFDVVFVISFLVGLLGLGILVTFVHNPARTTTGSRAGATPGGVTWRDALRLLRDRQFRLLVFAGSLLALTVIGDAFVYLTYQRRIDFDPRYLTLLPVGAALVYLLLAVPIGRLADRVGRARVFIAGYVALAGVYGLLLVPSLGGVALWGGLILLGAFSAATDGTLIALTSSLVSPERRASGIAVVTTATALTGLAASILFGAWWTWNGPVASVELFLSLLGISLVVGVALLAPGRASRRAGRHP